MATYCGFQGASADDAAGVSGVSIKAVELGGNAAIRRNRSKSRALQRLLRLGSRLDATKPCLAVVASDSLR